MTIKKRMVDYSQEISTVAIFGGSGPYQPEKVEETQRIFNESNTNIVTEYGTKCSNTDCKHGEHYDYLKMTGVSDVIKLKLEVEKYQLQTDAKLCKISTSGPFLLNLALPLICVPILISP